MVGVLTVVRPIEIGRVYPAAYAVVTVMAKKSGTAAISAIRRCEAVMTVPLVG